jgi:hypothetical protein
MPDTLTAGQRRTAKARAAFQQSFPSPEAKTSHYRAMAEKAAAGRIVLSGDDVEAFSQAVALLRRIAHKLPAVHGADTDGAAKGGTR